MCSFRNITSCLKPKDDRVFNHLGGLKNHLNFEKYNMIGFYVDQKDHGWVKVHHKMDDVTKWYPMENAIVEDSAQFVFKVFYRGLIFQDPVWWIVEGMLNDLEYVCDQVVDLTELTESETDEDLDGDDASASMSDDEVAHVGKKRKYIEV